jgi:hypothetical protein
MAQVIVLQEMLHSRVKRASQSPGLTTPPAMPLAGEHIPDREAVDRSLLLLDIAARHTRLIAMRISDPSRREYFEAQVASIEQQLQLARGMAMKL